MNLRSMCCIRGIVGIKKTGGQGDLETATNEFCVLFGEILNIEIGDRRNLGLGQSQIENPKSKISDNITKELIIELRC